MGTRTLVVALALLAGLVGTGPALSQTRGDCAALAADPFEPGQDGVGLQERRLMDSAAALNACLAAREADDDDHRIMAWLARAHMAAGDYDSAVPLLQMAALENNVLALQLYGDMLVTGEGVEQDMERGSYMLSIAAGRGFAPAQSSLGVSYQYGEGVEVDYVRSTELYRASAKQGYARGQSNYGYMLEMGYGVDQDYEQAATFYQMAADQDLPVAQHNLGWLYENGRGVPQDDDRAFSLYLAASEAGDAGAATNLGLLYLQGRGTELDYEEARYWTEIGVDGGDAAAINNLGHIYENGFGVDVDLERALSLYREAEALGNAMAGENALALSAVLDGGKSKAK